MHGNFIYVRVVKMKCRKRRIYWALLLSRMNHPLASPSFQEHIIYEEPQIYSFILYNKVSQTIVYQRSPAGVYLMNDVQAKLLRQRIVAETLLISKQQPYIPDVYLGK